MLKSLIGAAVVALLPTMVSAQTFSGSQTAGSDTATYSITTNGTVGNLLSSDITGWNVTLTNGSIVDTYGSATNSLSYFSGVSSDGSNLYFDFNAGGALFFDSKSDDYLCFQNFGCFNPEVEGVGINLAGVAGVNNATTSAQSGTQIIATLATGAVPEPATWAMMLFGFGAIGIAVRRRKCVLQQLA